MAANSTGEEETLVARVTVSLFLAVVLCSSLVLNILLLVVWSCSPRLRRPPNYLLVVLAGVDLAGTLLWCLPSLTASAGWGWVLGDDFCQVQGIVSTWCFTVTTTCFMVIALEKLIKLVTPSRHPQAFYKTSVYIMLCAVGVYALVIGLFPVMTFGQVVYIPSQAQCHFLFERSTSHLIFLFSVTYCIPLVLCSSSYITAGSVVWYRKKKSESGRVILEEDNSVPQKTFGQRLKEMEAKFRNASQKNKPKMVRGIGLDQNIQGQPNGVTEESSSSELSQEEDPDEVVTHYVAARYKMAEKVCRKRRIYHLRRRDLRLTLTTLLMTLIYFALWLPFWIVSFLWTYVDISHDLHTTVTVVTFVGLAYKPFLYLVHQPFRQAARRHLCGGFRKPAPTPNGSPGYEQQVDDEAPESSQQIADDITQA